MPLNADAYLQLSLNAPNQPSFATTLDVLDGAGRGSATLALPAGLPAGLAGVTLQHAFLALELSSGVVCLVSIARPLMLTP